MSKPREFASFGLEVAKANTSGNTLSGYASVFNYPIESGVRGFEQTTYLRPGAFKRTLQQNRDNIQVLFNHGMDPRYGGLPIGVVKELHEDSHGLWSEVELHGGPDNENIRAALASGALRAQSIQFEVVKEDYNDDRSERNIREVKLYEFGPVTFPANEAATASLHSVALPQPEAPVVETRDSTLDEARLTLVMRNTRQMESYDKQVEDFEKWLKEVTNA